MEKRAGEDWHQDQAEHPHSQECLHRPLRQRFAGWRAWTQTGVCWVRQAWWPSAVKRQARGTPPCLCCGSSVQTASTQNSTASVDPQLAKVGVRGRWSGSSGRWTRRTRGLNRVDVLVFSNEPFVGNGYWMRWLREDGRRMKDGGAKEVGGGGMKDASREFANDATVQNSRTNKVNALEKARIGTTVTESRRARGVL